MKRILALFAVASLALPVQAKAQFAPAVPNIPPPNDSTYMSMFLQAETFDVDVKGAGRYWGMEDSSAVMLVGFLAYSYYNGNSPNPPQYYEPFGNVEYRSGSCGITFTSIFLGTFRVIGFRYALQPDICYGPISIMQVKRKQNDAANTDIYLEFGEAGTDMTISEKNDVWNYMSKSGGIIVEEDTLFYKDALFTKFVGHPCSEAADQWGTHEYPKHDIYLGVCWPETGITWENDDVINIDFFAPQYRQKPAKPTGDLQVRSYKINGIPIAGSVWVSWRIPTVADTPAEQIALEKEDDIYYEFQVLRDGDKKWHTFLIDDTELDAIDSFTDFFGGVHQRQRRRYRIKGLDPDGVYAFCIRALNPGGAGEKICNYAEFKPVSAESAEIPITVTLAQNYPNPFNPSTAITYELPAAEHVRIDVFDVSGRNVKVLVDGTRPAGTHTARFDAGGLPSGLYVYRLQAGGNTIVKTMHLIR